MGRDDAGEPPSDGLGTRLKADVAAGDRPGSHNGLR